MVYEGGGGVEKVQKSVYVVYERPLTLFHQKRGLQDIPYYFKADLG